MNAIATDLPSPPAPATAPSARLASSAPAPSKGARWGGRVASGLAIAFLGFDASLKLFQVGAAIEGSTQLGWPASSVLWLGVVELACLVAYVVPRSALLGAILWTGYLGGAIATHVRVGSPLFSHALFPVYVAALLWGGLWLRRPELRALIPLARRTQ